MKANPPLQAPADTHYDQLDWLPIPARLSAGKDAQHLTKKQLQDWSLVLAAKQIPWRSQLNATNHSELYVPAPFFLAACHELRQFEAENRNWPPRIEEIKTTENTVATIWILILLAVFHNLTTHQINIPNLPNFDWFSAGNADAEKIVSGQWWRTVTALTLHSGALHLTGNIIFGGIIITRLAHLLSSGPAWFLIIVSGAIGNLINALVHGQNHHSIGFSTSVFAALAILSVTTMALQTRYSWRRWPLPLMAGCALLALMGTSGEQTDLGAHLFGFFSGILCAAMALKLPLPAVIRKHINGLFALFTGILLVGSWMLALLSLN